MRSKGIELFHSHIVAVRLVDAIRKEGNTISMFPTIGGSGFKVQVTEVKVSTYTRFKLTIQPAQWSKSSFISCILEPKDGWTWFDLGEVVYERVGGDPCRFRFGGYDHGGDPNHPPASVTIRRT